MHRGKSTLLLQKVTITYNCKQLVLKILSWELNGLAIILGREISTAVTKA